MSTQDNARLLEQLKSSFERTTGRVTVTTKVTVNQQNRYSNFLIDPNFQQVNRFFVLLFIVLLHKILSSTSGNKGP